MVPLGVVWPCRSLIETSRKGLSFSGIIPEKGNGETSKLTSAVLVLGKGPERALIAEAPPDNSSWLGTQAATAAIRVTRASLANRADHELCTPIVAATLQA